MHASGSTRRAARIVRGHAITGFFAWKVILVVDGNETSCATLRPRLRRGTAVAHARDLHGKIWELLHGAHDNDVVVVHTPPTRQDLLVLISPDAHMSGGEVA